MVDPITLTVTDYKKSKEFYENARPPQATK